MFRKEGTSDLAGFHAGPPPWSNWNLEMLVFVEGGNPKNSEKNPQSKARINNKLKPRGRTWATLVEGERSYRLANPDPPDSPEQRETEFRQ